MHRVEACNRFELVASVVRTGRDSSEQRAAKVVTEKGLLAILFLADKSEELFQVDHLASVLRDALKEKIVQVRQVDIHHHIFDASRTVSPDVGSRHTSLDVRQLEMDAENAFETGRNT